MQFLAGAQNEIVARSVSAASRQIFPNTWFRMHSSIFSPMFIILWSIAFGTFLGIVRCSADGENCAGSLPPNSVPKDFDELQKYAHLASVAYCLEKGLEEGIVGTQGPKCPSKACFHSETRNLHITKAFEFKGLFEVGSSIIAIDKPSKSIYLAFMGTSTYQDWLNNLSIMPVSYQPLVVTSDDFTPIDNRKCNNCKVHKGINSFLKLNGGIVLKELLKIKQNLPNYRLVVTGHSLGAALAIFAGIEIRLMGLDVLVVTLAGPKIGEKNFARFVDDLFETDKVVSIIDKEKSFDGISTALIRMIHLHDVVPYLPPTKYFKHSGYEYFLAGEGVHQTPQTIDRRGKSYLEDEHRNYLEVLPNFRRLDHANYFLPVSHCI